MAMNTTSPRFRAFLVWGVMIAAGVALGMNLYRLQVLETATLEKRAREQQMVYLRPFVPRREIVDRAGNILATDRPVYTLFVHPKLFKESKSAIAEKMAGVLSLSPAELEQRFNQRASGIRLSDNLPEESADHLRSLRIDGIELIQRYGRLYPQEDLAAEVVGYVNLDHRGQAGLEYSQEQMLERSVRTMRLSRAGNGMLMPDHLPEGFLHFDELKLHLTLDSRLQRAARTALKQQMETFRAKRGAVIVLDALDGSILSLATEPTYNPNEYSQADISLFKNWAISDLYEPGSTFKPINVAIALENKAIEPTSRFNDSGRIQVGDRSIKNAEGGGYGSLSIGQILEVSSNIGMVQIAQRMQPEAFYSWLERLGLGQKVGTDLPFEATGFMKSQEKFLSSPLERAVTSFGQGFSLTPLQLVQLHGALANGGKLVSPHFVKGLYDTKGQAYWQPQLPSPRQVFSPETTREVVEMMEGVVTKGTGKGAQIPGYRIGGKTGTAQKASPRGGYSNARITSFVAILPVDAPRYVVLAVVDEPQGGNAYGSTVAVPIVKPVMEALIAIERIPPSTPTTPNP